MIVLTSSVVINLYNIANYLLGKKELTEVCSALCKTSKMEFFAKIVSYRLLAINYFARSFFLIVTQGAEYASDYVPNNYTESERHSQKSS